MTCNPYQGNKLSFRIINKKNIGPGSNSKVFEIELLDQKVSGKYIAKFFYCDKAESKDERYSRFLREIDFLESYSDLPGILPLLDKCCPKTPSDEKPAWYIMPKASAYSVKKSRTLQDIIENIIPLAVTIKLLHEKKYAHRDIKPENILYYQNRLCLIDFGLLWSSEEKRLTTHEERIGPYKILPPELTTVNPLDDSVDFCASDVYLFAKVLWMMIMRDNEGFSGPYRRNRELIYLSLDHYASEVSTLEPLQLLLEQATVDEYQKRINIHECIDLLTTQLCLIRYNNQSHVYWQSMTDAMAYSEQTKYIIERNEPVVKEYTDKSVILKMLQGLFDHTKTIIRQIDSSPDSDKQINFHAFEPNDNNSLIFKCFTGNIFVLQVRIFDYTMRYYPDSEEVVLVPGDPLDRKGKDEIYYSGSLSDNNTPGLRKYVLTQNARLVFLK